jgi:transposase InsO family protein
MEEMRSEFSIGELAEAFEVSRSGYYAWRQRRDEPSARSRENAVLLLHIASIHEENQERYGSPRIHQALRQAGIRCGHNRVARLMRSEGIRAVSKRPFRPRTTQAGAQAAPNLLLEGERPQRPDQVWVADITYIWTVQGWLYLAAVMDLFSRRIVGWHAADHLRSSLAEAALEQAMRLRRPPPGLIHHSDRGFQYSSQAYLAALNRAQAQPSMSRKGDCYDNAVMEAFWSSLKSELIYRQGPLSRSQTIAELFQYIDLYYNQRRLHSALGYRPPAAFEQQHGKVRRNSGRHLTGD